MTPDPSMMLGKKKKHFSGEPMIMVGGMAPGNDTPCMFTIPGLQAGTPMCMNMGNEMGMSMYSGMGIPGWIPLGSFPMTPEKLIKQPPTIQQPRVPPDIPVWMYIVIGAVLSVIVPFCGLPALYYGIKARRLVKQKKYHRAKKASSRSVTFSIIGLCVLTTVIAVAFSVGMTVHYVKLDICNDDVTNTATQRPTLDPSVVDSVHRIVGSVTSKAEETIRDLAAENQFYDNSWTDNQVQPKDIVGFQQNDAAEFQIDDYFDQEIYS